MITPDAINGGFELSGAAFSAANVARLMVDKRIAGVSWPATAFFTAWGGWNLFYYPHLGQYLSFVGGCAIVVVNAVWLALVWRFTRRAR